MSREGVRGHRLNVHSMDNWGLSPHPSSSVSNLQEHEYGQATCAIFQSKMLTSNLYLSDVTLVSRLNCLLFGGAAVSYHPPRDPMSASQLPNFGRGVVGLVQGGWMAVVSTTQMAQALQRLHLGIRAFVAENVVPGTKVDTEKAAAFVTAIGKLLQGTTHNSFENKYSTIAPRLRIGSSISASRTSRQAASYRQPVATAHQVTATSHYSSAAVPSTAAHQVTATSHYSSAAVPSTTPTASGDQQSVSVYRRAGLSVTVALEHFPHKHFPTVLRSLSVLSNIFYCQCFCKGVAASVGRVQGPEQRRTLLLQPIHRQNTVGKASAGILMSYDLSPVLLTITS